MSGTTPLLALPAEFYFSPTRTILQEFTGSDFMLPELLQKVLLGLSPCTKEGNIGLALLMALVLKSNEFDSVHKVGNLGESIEIWAHLAIHQRLLRERVFKSSVQSPRYQTLVVVIVDFYRFEPLEALQILEEKINDISSHFLLERGTINKLALAIHNCLVAEGDVPSKRSESEQIARPHLNTLIREVTVPMCQRHKMKLLVLQAPFTEELLVSCHFPGNIVRLVMEDKGQDVVLGIQAKVAGLVNENGKLAHLGSPQKTRMPGDPPALDGSPCVETHLLYTTRRFDHSIVPRLEYMFSTIKANICSIYRKVA